MYLVWSLVFAYHTCMPTRNPKEQLSDQGPRTSVENKLEVKKGRTGEVLDHTEYITLLDVASINA